MSKSTLIILAQGFEEIEAITTIDILDRAGIEVTTAGLSNLQTTGAHGLTVTTTTLLESVETLPDILVIPGGMPGSENLANSTIVKDWIIKMYNNNKLIAAICASPALVLTPTGILNGKKATCYPGMETYFNNTITFIDSSVVIDENIITSRGPATAMEFALTIVEQALDQNTAETIRKLVLG